MAKIYQVIILVAWRVSWWVACHHINSLHIIIIISFMQGIYTFVIIIIIIIIIQ